MSCLAMVVIFLGLKNHLRIQKTGYRGTVTGQFWVAYSIACRSSMVELLLVCWPLQHMKQVLEMQTFFFCG